MIDDYFESFIEGLVAEKGASENTVSSYLFDLQQFSDYFQNTDIKKINKDALLRFVADLQKKQYSSKSIARKLSTLRDFFKFLLSENIISANPTINLETPKKERLLPDFLTQQEILKLIDTAQNSQKFTDKRNAAMITLMYACGLRVSELVNIKISALNFDKGVLFIKGKGNKERLVPIAGAAIDILSNYIEKRECFLKKHKSDFLFPSAKTPASALTRDVFFKQLKDLALSAGINPEKVHPHILRHSFATFLINNNVNLRSVQKMLGHENIVTTEIYTHILPENIKNEVFQKHPLAQNLNQNIKK